MSAETFEQDTHSGERHHSIEIRIDNRPYQVTDDHMTGIALKGLGSIPPDYQLFEEVPGPEADPGIRDDQIVTLHSGLKFYAVPAGTLG